MKKLLLLIFGVLSIFPAIAEVGFRYTYEGKTVNYSILDAQKKTAMVKSGTISVDWQNRDFYNESPGTNVYGDLIIPSTVEYEGEKYTVVEIGMCAFTGNRLTSVSIPETVTKLGFLAFYNCEYLVSVICPNAVFVDDYDGINGFYSPFDGCTSLKKAAVLSRQSYLFPAEYVYECNGSEVVDGNILFNKSKTGIYIVNPGIKEDFAMPATVTEINDMAFAYCNKITSIELATATPPSITGTTFAWEGGNLYETTKLIIPDGTLSNYTPTFWGFFKNIEYSSGQPAEVKKYSDGVLNYILNPAQNSDGRNTATVTTGNYSGDVNIPERFTDMTDPDNPVRYYITEISDGAFANTGISSITFNDRIDLKTIGAEAFKECNKLKSIEIPNSVVNIGFGAFSGCSGIESVKIGESVEYIGNDAFYKCTGVTKSEFARVESLCGIYFGNTGANPMYKASSKALYINGKRVYSVEVPSTVTSLRGTFAGANVEVTLPESLDTIGYCTFASSGSFPRIPNSVTVIEDYAFYQCDNYTSESLKLPEGLKSIGNFALWTEYVFDKAKIPASVESIGNSAIPVFDLSVEDGTQPLTLGENALGYPRQLHWGRPIANPDTKFLNTDKLATLSIGNTVKSINTTIFGIRTTLTSLTLGNSITDICDNAFKGCTGLTEVILPPSVETIGASAFAGDTGLASIIMGHNVKTIGDKAFDGCPASTVSITAQTPPSATNTTFSNYSGRLWLQGQAAMNAYYDAYTCWDRFNSYAMVEPTEMTTDGAMSYTGKAGETIQLKATLMPENVTLPQVFWRSTNPDIAIVDQNGLVTLMVDLEEVMTMATDGDSDVATCKIIAESLYADGPSLEFTVNSVQTDVDEIAADTATDAIDYNAPYEVYNLSGIYTGNSIDNLANGIYIVRQGANTAKVAVK